jgi:ribosomal protein S18 acetylase RimI-like enzyme
LKLGLKKLKNIEQIKQANFQSFWGLVVIGVDPNYQGKGIGSALLQEFERLARIDKVNRISLSVKSTNLKAVKSYISNGWLINKTTIDSLNLMKNL